ncbi:hypothetical protein FQA39_LY14131 [Lamprigera yunnana]|nr:hypothetical protein FQA39_LY14131 [Lamprigera yunnana]
MLLFLILLIAPITVWSSIINSFSDTNVKEFNHLTVDQIRGDVYVGAVNRLYHLSSQLEILDETSTGPKDDSDDFNKVLVIDYNENGLIYCGSLQQTCEVYNLSNTREIFGKSKEKVVSENQSASTIAFLGRGPSNGRQVMYVGVTFKPGATILPAISSRTLNNKTFTLVTSEAKIDEGYSYFLTNQLKNTSSTQYVSKLVRVCQEDDSYYSYTEIPMICNKGDVNFNLAQAAFVGKPGAKLAKELAITTKDSVLFVVFSEKESEKSNKPSNSSALCMYSLKYIRRKFIQNIQTCFSGKVERGLDFITPSMPCFHTNLFIGDEFCGLDINTPFGGEDPITSVPIIQFNTTLTAVAANSVGDSTMVYVGTATGHLKKIIVDADDNAVEYEDLLIEEDLAINSDLKFDHELKSLYVMTKNKISKIQVDTVLKPRKKV